MLTRETSFAIHLIRSKVQACQYVVPFYRTMSSAINKINFNPRHLKTGDPLPPYNGKLRIYNMRYCPYAHRTILVLNAKKIDYEVVNIDLVDKPEWLTSKSMFGKVPAIEIKDGVTICESLITAEYLDEVFPQRPLISKDPLRKAQDKIIIEAFGPITSAFIAYVRTGEIPEEKIEEYKKVTEFIQNELISRGSKFLGGNLPGFVDYMIWPWFERIKCLDIPSLRLDPVKFKVLEKYIENMFTDPAVASYVVKSEILRKVMEGYLTGTKPNYNIILE